jgi:hypothetical protein
MLNRRCVGLLILIVSLVLLTNSPNRKTKADQGKPKTEEARESTPTDFPPKSYLVIASDLEKNTGAVLTDCTFKSQTGQRFLVGTGWDPRDIADKAVKKTWERNANKTIWIAVTHISRIIVVEDARDLPSLLDPQ